MIRRPPRSTPLYSSAASDVYKRQVSVSRAYSSSLDRSAEERASRDTSNPKIAPTSPRQTRATSPLKPSRPSVDRPDTPRSASMTSMEEAGQPSRAASSIDVIDADLGVSG